MFCFCHAHNAIAWNDFEAKLGYKNFGAIGQKQKIDIKRYGWDGKVEYFKNGSMDGEVVFIANLYRFEDHSELIRGDCNEDYVATVVIGYKVDDELQDNDADTHKIWFQYAPLPKPKKKEKQKPEDSNPYATKFAPSKLKQLRA